MKYLLFLIVLTGCGARQSDELDSLAKDAIKSKSDIQIDVKSTPRQ